MIRWQQCIFLFEHNQLQPERWILDLADGADQYHLFAQTGIYRWFGEYYYNERADQEAVFYLNTALFYDSKAGCYLKTVRLIGGNS